MLKFPILTFLLLINCFASAQTNKIKGRIVERYTNFPLAFSHIIINENEEHIFANEDGHFEITHPSPIKNIRVKHFLYRDALIPVIKEDTFLIELIKFSLFEFQEKNSTKADKLIYKVLLNKKQNDVQTFLPHSYNTYNKLVISTDKLEEALKLFERNVKILGIKLKPFKKDHNLILAESVTEKTYLNDLNQRENIIGSKLSGIKQPSFYTLSSLLLPGSIYNNYIPLASLSFLGPLNDKALSTYYFQVVDTAFIDSQPIYAIKFTPARKNTDALKGLLYIHGQSYAVVKYIISPAYDDPPIEIAQSFSFESNRKWFPQTTRTNYFSNRFGKEKIRLNITIKSIRKDLKFRDDLKAKDFNDVILKYANNASKVNETFWDTNRITPLSSKDTNTYSFYDTIGSIKRFERFTRIGEGVYNGVIPINIFNIEVDKLISSSQYEGLRLGLGGHTNSLFSDKLTIGSYFGYGSYDGEFKYGIEASFVADKNTELTLSSSLSKDLMESGGIDFPFDRNQYSTESLRKYRISIMDRLTRKQFLATIKPMRYVYLSTGLNLENISPTYSYSYKELTPEQYLFAEYNVGLKLALGEKFMQSSQNKFLLYTKYPILWIEYRKSFKNFLIGDYSYNKVDIKLQYSYKAPGLGRQSIQILAGIANGSLPYFKLYNMRGSWRAFSVVIHNSFETMQYNEFLSDRYFAINYAHDLGKINIRRPNINPGLEILHNFGIGSLKKPGEHQKIPFKTMGKGYLESGVFIYDIITLRALGIKTGLGTGLFMRYGPYARENFIDNFVYKLGLSFSL